MAFNYRLSEAIWNLYGTFPNYMPSVVMLLLSNFLFIQLMFVLKKAAMAVGVLSSKQLVVHYKSPEKQFLLIVKRL